MQSTTDPKTGQCRVYGVIDNEVVQDALNQIVEQLFVKSDGSKTRLLDVARYIAQTVPINNNEIACRLREIGFKNERNLNAESVIRLNAWKHLKNAIQQKYEVVEKRDRTAGRYYRNLLFTKVADINISSRNSKDE